MRFASSLAALFSSAALLPIVCALPRVANAQTTVNYAAMGSFIQAAPLNTGGITATSTGTAGPLHIEAQGGGAIGGLGVGDASSSRYTLINDGERVLFTFNAGPATNVSVSVGNGIALPGPTPSRLEAFGVNNNSLGTFDFYAYGSNFFTNPDLSSRVGGVAISSFQITGGSGGTGASVSSITYTPAAINAVPEPGEWATMGMAGAGLCGLMVRARRKKAAGATLAA